MACPAPRARPALPPRPDWWSRAAAPAQRPGKGPRPAPQRPIRIAPGLAQWAAAVLPACTPPLRRTYATQHTNLAPTRMGCPRVRRATYYFWWRVSCWVGLASRADGAIVRGGIRRAYDLSLIFVRR